MTYAPLSVEPEEAIRAAFSGGVRGISVLTSGSTGEPRTVLIGGHALRYSAEASLSRLGGPGRWLLAIPADRIGGAQVLARSIVAGTTPLRIAPGVFTAAHFREAAHELLESTPAGTPLYTSLVPTQLRRILEDPAATKALDVFAAILVGGAAWGSSVRPANVVTTYGMTETAGGCVYNGVPLDGVEVRADPEGRLLIAGPVLCDGFADGDVESFVTIDERRWLRSPDLGSVEGGIVTVTGRVDDVIVTGGHKVHPATVERALSALPGVTGAAVNSVPDQEWGRSVVAIVVVAKGAVAPSLDSLQEQLRDALPRHALPRRVIVVDSLPLLETGKIDREAIRLLAERG